jgi:hypothetical protein
MLNLSSYRHGNKKALLRHTCDKIAGAILNARSAARSNAGIQCL